MYTGFCFLQNEEGNKRGCVKSFLVMLNSSMATHLYLPGFPPLIIGRAMFAAVYRLLFSNKSKLSQTGCVHRISCEMNIKDDGDPFGMEETEFYEEVKMELESFPEGGLPSKLEDLRIHCCKKLIGNRMQSGLPTLTSLKFLMVDLRGCEQVVDSFPDEGLLPTTLRQLRIYSISKLDRKGFTQLTSLKMLEIHNCPELRCLPDEALRTSLSDLEIHDCPLLEQRYRRETGEDWPNIARINRIRLNFKYI